MTGIADTSSLVVGQPIVGNGIPGYIYNMGSQSKKQTKILSIDSSSQITLSAKPMIAGVQQLSVNPTPSGVVTFTTARFYNTNPASGTYAWRRRGFTPRKTGPTPA